MVRTQIWINPEKCGKDAEFSLILKPEWNSSDKEAFAALGLWIQCGETSHYRQSFPDWASWGKGRCSLKSAICVLCTETEKSGLIGNALLVYIMMTSHTDNLERLKKQFQVLSPSNARHRRKRAMKIMPMKRCSSNPSLYSCCLRRKISLITIIVLKKQQKVPK